MRNRAYKIMTARDWAAFQAAGAYDGSPVDLRDGYIHLSAADQLTETASKHYAGQDSLMLLEVELAPYGSAVVWEPSRGCVLFPHLYGRLTVETVIRASPFRVTDAGAMIFEDAA